MLGFVWVFRRDGCRADEHAHTVFAAAVHDFTDGVEILLLVGGIGFEAPADVVNTVSDGEEGCSLGEDG